MSEPRPDQIADPPGQVIAPGTQSGIFRGRLVIIQGSSANGSTGLFAYSGTPASGNLVYSVAAVAGTDPYGNAYLAGATSYTASGGIFYAAQVNGQTITLTSAASAAGPYSTVNATIALDATFTNLVIQAANSVVLSALNGNTNVGIGLFPNVTAPSNPASGALVYASNSSLFLLGTAGPARKFQGTELPSTNTVTVTQAAFTNLSNVTITTGNTQVGDTYRFHVTGYGTWGSTQQALTFQARFGAAASNVVGTPVTIAATALAASAAFFWSVTVTLICLTTGMGATWIVLLEGCIDQVANALLPGTAADGTIPFVTGSGSSDVTLDSTVNEIFGLSAKWASTTGTPTISKRASWLEKIR